MGILAQVEKVTVVLGVGRKRVKFTCGVADLSGAKVAEAATRLVGTDPSPGALVRVKLTGHRPLDARGNVETSSSRFAVDLLDTARATTVLRTHRDMVRQALLAETTEMAAA